MGFFSWRQWLNRKPRSGRRSYSARPNFRHPALYLEHLEERMAPATDVWTGGNVGNANYNWNNPLNWSNSAIPQPGDDLVFPPGVAPASLTNNNNLSSGTVFNSISFSGSNYFITGNPLGLGSTSTNGSLVANVGATNDTVNVNITLSGAGNQFFTVNTASAFLTVGSVGSPTGNISSSSGAGLTKSGPGTLIFGGNNSGFPGSITVQAGALQITNPLALGPGVTATTWQPSASVTTVLSGAQLQVSGPAASGISGIPEPLILNGPGISNSGALLNVQGNNSWAGPVELDSDATVGASAGALVINGQVSDTGAGHSLTKEGAGAIDLDPLGVADGNTYRGGTIINAGILGIRHSLALGPGGSADGGTVVNSNPDESGTLQLQFVPNVNRVDNNATSTGFTVLDENLTLNGPGQEGIHVSPRVGATATGTITTVTGAMSNASGSNFWEGPIVLWSGTNSVQGDPAFWSGPTPTVGFGAEANSTLTIDGQISDQAGGTAYAIIKTRPGTVVFTDANTFTGKAEVLQGTLALADSKALGPQAATNGAVVLPGGALALQADAKPDSFNSPSPFYPAIKPTDITVKGVPLTLLGPGANPGPGPGAGSGTGALHNISGTNEWTGSVTLLNSIGFGPQGFSSFGGSIGVEPDPDPFNAQGLGYNDFSQLTVSGPVGGTTLTKVDNGELVLTNANTYTGTWSGTAQQGTFINQGWITARNALALGHSYPFVTDPELPNNPVVTFNDLTLQPMTYVASGAALVLKTDTNVAGMPTNQPGSPIVVDANLTLSGLGLTTANTQRQPWLIQDGSLENLDGVNSEIGNIVLNGNGSIGAEQDGNLPEPPPTPGPLSEMILTGNISELTPGSGITKEGSQRVILQGPGSYTGPDVVAAGVLRIQNSTALGVGLSSTGVALTTTVASGAALEIAASVPVETGGLVVGTQILNEHLILNGPGNTSAFNYNSPGAPIAALTSVSDDNLWRGAVTLASTSSMDVDPSSRLTIYGAIDDAANASANGSGLTIGGDGGATGELVLAGGGSYRGTTLIDQGTVNLQAGSSLGAPSTAESQTVTVTATSGNFTLTFNGQTATLPFNATAAQVQTALNALTSVTGPGGNVAVTQSFNQYTVTFNGNLLGFAQNLMSATGATVVENTAGHGGVVVTSQASINLQGDITVPGKSLQILGTGATTTNLGVSESWFPIGPAPTDNGQNPTSQPVSGRVTGVSVDQSDPNVMFLSAADGGVWKTTDGGQTWQALTDQVDGVQAVTVPGTSGTFVLTFNGQSTTALPFNASAYQVQTALDALSTIGMVGGDVSVSLNQGVYTITFEGALGYTTQPPIGATGAGATVAVVTQGLSLQDLSIGAIAVAPENPNIIYVGSGEGNNSTDSLFGEGIYESIDSGRTWSLLPGSAMFDQSPITKIVVDPIDPLIPIKNNGITPPSANNPNIIYVAVDGSGTTPNSVAGKGGIWKFNPAASPQWTNLTVGQNPTDSETTIVFSANDDYTDLAVVPDDGQFSPSGLGGGNLVNPGNHILEMTIGTAVVPGDGLGAGFSTATSLGAVPVPYHNGAYISLFDGLPNTWNNGNYPTEITIAGTGPWPRNGVVKGGLGAITAIGADASATEYVAYDANTYPGNYASDFLLGTSLSNTFEDLQSSTIVWSYVTLKWAIGGFSATSVQPGPYMDTFPYAQGEYDTVFAASPTNGNVVFVAGVGGPFTPAGGILENTAGGASGSVWFSIDVGADGAGPHGDYHSMSFDGQGRLLVTTDGGVWRLDNSAQGQIHWTDLNGNLAISEQNGLAVNPLAPFIAYAGSQGNGLEASSTGPNNSITWTQTSKDTIDPLDDGGNVAVDNLQPNIVFGVQDGQLFKSTNSGATWQSIFTVAQFSPVAGDLNAFSWHSLIINGTLVTSAAGPNDEVEWGNYFAKGADNTAGPPHYILGGQYFPLIIDDVNPSRILIGNGNAPWESTQQGNAGTFVDLDPNGQIASTFPVFSDGVRHETMSALAYATDQGAFMADPSFPDVIDQGSSSYVPGTIYAVASNFATKTGVYVTKDHGNTWVERDTGLPSNANITAITVDPNNSDIAFVVINSLSGGQVWKTSNAGQTWTLFTGSAPNALPNVPATSVLVNPKDESLYVGTASGVWVSPAGAPSWQRLGVGMPNVYVTGLTLDPNNDRLSAATFGRGSFELWLDDSLPGSGSLRAVSGESFWTGPMALTGNITIQADLNAQITIGGAVSNNGTGNFTITKVGPGTLVLAGSNSYGGGSLTTDTFIDQGVLDVQNPNALGATSSGTIVEPGAALELESSVNGEPLQLNGDGMFFNGHNTGALRSISNNNTYSGPITLNTASTIGVDSGSQLTITGVIGANMPAYTLTKELAGTLVLSADNTYGGPLSPTRSPAGQTFVIQGALQVTNPGALGITDGTADTGVFVTDGAQLQLQDGVTVPNTYASLAGTGINGTGALLSLGNGITPVNNTWLGPISLTYTPGFSPPTIPVASVNIGVANPIDTLTIGGAIGETTYLDSVNPANDIINFGPDKVGAGTLIFQNIDSYTGLTTVSTGILNIQNTLALPTPPGIAEVQQVKLGGTLGGTFTLTFNGSTTTALSSSAAPAAVQAALNALLSIGGVGASVTVSGSSGGPYSVTFGGSLQGFPLPPISGVGGGGLTVTDTETKQGTGGTVVANGATLQVDLPSLTIAAPLMLNGLGVNGSGALDNVAGNNIWSGPFVLLNTSSAIGDDGGTLTIRSNVTGAPSATLDKVGTGTVILQPSSPNQYQGLTQVQNGILNVPEQGALGGGNISEVEAVTSTGLSGTFTLSYNGSTTVPLAYNATAAQVQAALNALPSITGNVGGSVSVSLTGASDVQTVTVTGVSGSFALGFNGSSTGSISYPATAAQVQTALNALPTIGGVGGSVSVSLTGTVYTITFGGSLALFDQPPITVSNIVSLNSVVPAILTPGTGVFNVTFLGNLAGFPQQPNPPYPGLLATGAGTTAAIGVSEVTAGSGGTSVDTVAAVQSVYVTGATGTFTLAFNGSAPTAALPLNTTASAVQAALNGLSTIGGVGGSVTVTGQLGGPFTVGFGGSLAGFTLPLLTGTGTGTAVVTVNAVQTVAVAGATGSFSIDFNGADTLSAGLAAPIQLGSSAAQVQAALAALPTVGAGNVIVTLAGNVYTIVFQGALAGLSLPPISALGAAGAVTTTTINDGQSGTLQIQGNTSYSGETLELSGPGFDGIGALDSPSGTNVWNSPIVLVGPASVASNGASGQTLSIDQAIGELVAGSTLTEVGLGTVVLDGAASNTYTGTTFVNSGTLQLDKSGGAIAIPSGLTIGTGTGSPQSDVVQLLANNQINPTATVTINSDGELDLQSAQQTLSTIDMTGGLVSLTNAPSQLNVNGTLTASEDANGLPATVSGFGTLFLPAGATETFTVNGPGSKSPDMLIASVIGGPGNFIKAGDGVLQLTADETYTGTTTLTQGTLLADGPLPGNTVGIVSLNGTGNLAGIGAVGGINSLASGGTVSPGDPSNPTGTLTSNGSVSWNAATTYNVLLDGTSFGQTSVLNVNGTVNLGGAALMGTLGSGFIPAVGGNPITILTATGLISGTFASEFGVGGAVFIGGLKFQVIITNSGTINSVQVQRIAANTTTVLTSSANPSIYGQLVTFTATVTAEPGATGVPVGTFAFFVDGAQVASGVPDDPTTGIATYSTPLLSVTGSPHTVNAFFTDTDNIFNDSDSTANPVLQTIKRASTQTVVTASADPAVFGQTVTFTATVVAPSSTLAPTGTVTFIIDGKTVAANVSLNAGVATYVTSTLSVTTGTPHTVLVNYANTDGNFISNSGATLPGGETVNKAGTTITVASTSSPAAYGSEVITATVAAAAPGAGSPSGFVTFSVNNGTTTTTETDALALVSGNQVATLQLVPSPGTYTITATYSGDSAFLSNSVSNALSQVVTAALTTVSVSSNINPSVFGQPVTFSAVISAVAPGGVAAGSSLPGGTASLIVDSTVVYSNVAVTNGAVTFAATTTGLTAINSPHAVEVLYNGDTNYAGNSNTLANGQTVNKANVSVSVASNANPSVYGQPVTFSATISPIAPGGGSPGGTASLFIDGSTTAYATVSVSNGSVSFPADSALSLTPGAGHLIDVVYNGDAGFNGGVSGLLNGGQKVKQASTQTTIQASANPAVYGQNVTFTATVAAQSPSVVPATGAVTFFVDNVQATSALPLNSSGVATFSISSLSVAGSPHSISATYTNSDGNFINSSGSLTGGETVGQANTSTTVTSSNTAAPYGGDVITATVAAVSPGGGTPTGTVTFSITQGSTTTTETDSLATVSGNQVATLQEVLAPGTFTITAAYNGSGNFLTSSSASSPLSQTVSQAFTTVAVSSNGNPSVFGQAVTFSAIISASSPGGTDPGSLLPGGSASLVIGGTTVFANVTVTNGAVTFPQTTSGLTIAGSPHSVSVVYNGDTNYLGNSNSLAGGQTVTEASVSVTVSANHDPAVFGQPVTFSAAIAAVSPGAGSPGGTASLLIDGSTIFSNVAVNNGTVTFPSTTSHLSVGGSPHAVEVVYNGDGSFNANNGQLAGGETINLAGSSTSVSTSPSTSSYGQAVTLTATVSAVSPGVGIPSGTVIFYAGSVSPGDQLGQGSLNGLTPDQASYTTTNLQLTGGTYSIVAVYQGDASFGTSQGSSTQTVLRDATNTSSVSSSNTSTIYGQPVTLSATVSSAVAGVGVPTGTINFYVGAIAPADVVASVTVSSSGTATVTLPSTSPVLPALGAGIDTITAVYQGDTNFSGSTSPNPQLSQTVAKAASSTTVSSTNTNAVYGQETITATVADTTANSTGTPTGNVIFTISSGSGTTNVTVALVNGVATLTSPAAVATALSAGGSSVVYSIAAAYQGDANFNTSSSTSSVSQTVAQANSTVQLTANPSNNQSVAGQTVTFTAVVAAAAPGAGLPTGTVNFFDGSTSIGSGSLSLVNGQEQVSVSTSGLAASSTAHSITATYVGDSNFVGSSSNTVQFTVGEDNTSTAVSSSLPTSTYGVPVTFTATVASASPGSGTPAGNVSFYAGSIAPANLLGTGTLNQNAASDQASYTTTAIQLMGGTYPVIAVYQGNSAFATSQGSVSQTVQKVTTTTALTPPTTATVVGRPFTVTATVTPGNSSLALTGGSVVFTVDSGPPQSEPLNSANQAFFTVTFSTTGNHTISATYTGDTNFSASTPTTLSLPGLTPNEAYVAQVYLDLLGRPVDAGGLTAWSSLLDGNVISRFQFVSGLEASAEYRTDVIDAVYVHYLHRMPDSLGLNSFLTAMGNGMTDEQVAATLAGSNEYFANRGGGTVTGFITAMYNDVLNRNPDQGGLQAFTQALSFNVSRQQVASILLGSAEYKSDLLITDYNKFLHRNPDSNGLNSFVTAMTNGLTDEQVIATLLSSAEYFNNA